jgi:hypothetical protein
MMILQLGKEKLRATQYFQNLEPIENFSIGEMKGLL